MRLQYFTFLVVASVGLAPTQAAETLPETIRFNRDIRPILSNNCYQCHGPDEEHRKADLRLDDRDNVIKEIEAIIPGKSEESELYLRLVSPQKFKKMPPPKTNKVLKPREIALIKKWIDQGAKYEGHWAFVAPTRPKLPRVNNKDWIQTPIDHFILSRLEREKLKPESPTEKRALIRRVTFDLIGLPPTPQEVQSFVNDNSPDAYERLVDRLLASPHFGEHQARYWLDAIRYGDTHGLHLDNYREMWLFRDWVVKAFNENKRFDQFTLEQLAGDLLPNPTTDQLIASGYNRAHVTTSEGGSIAEEVYVRNVIDRVSTTSTVWMGLTAGCAVCHDHKFDPLSQREMYQLFAFFNNLEANPLDGNRKDHAPVIRVPTPDQERRLAMLKAERAEVTKQLQTRNKQIESAYRQWLDKVQAKAKEKKEPVTEGLILHYPLDETSGNKVSSRVGKVKPGAVKANASWKPGHFGGAFEFDGNRYIDLGNVGDFERNQAFSYGAWVNWNGSRGGGAILAKMNDSNRYRGYDLYLVNGQIAVHIINAWTDNTLKVTTNTKIPAKKWSHVFMTYDGSSRASGLKIYFDGKPQQFAVNFDTLAETKVNDKPLGNTIKAKVPLTLGRRTPGSRFVGLLDEVRIYNRELTGQEVASLAGTDPLAPLLAIDEAKRTPQQKQQLRQYYLQHVDPLYRKLTNQQKRLGTQIQQLEKQAPTTLVMKERANPREAFILKRGAYDQRGDKVERATPKFLPPLGKDKGVNRLDFAKWLVDEKHPLTARVAVNRFWQQMFGMGIVRTSEDFGIQGEFPSHVDLLDWLAVEFRESDWNVKRLLKQMVMSSTYQQASTVSPEKYAIDPENRLLSRGPRFRLDAEMLRDQALAISGLLVREMGGPSVKPPQPKGLWFAVGYTSSNTARFKQDQGSRVFRRSVYTFWKRTSPPPQMTIFDAPSREACVMRRERTNTPLQALLLMNERQYVESARHLGERMMREGGKTAAERLKFGFLQATARQPDETELRELLTTFELFKAEFQANAKSAKELIETGDTKPDADLDASELAAWTLVNNLILNLDEVLNKG